MHLRPSRIFQKRPHIPLFRIFYSTTFTVLTLILAAAVLITPGDHIYQSFHAGQIYHIFIIAGFYLLTLIIAVLFYGGRLYATRSALANIPKQWSITEEGKGVGIKLGKVGRVIQKGLQRSAWVAYDSMPRNLKEDGERGRRTTEDHLGMGVGAERKSEESEHSIRPPWGTISHPGWSSPSSPDLPNLHYEPVILELPHLIEAKAVSLASPDPLYEPPPESEAEEQQAPIPDPLAVSLLQRPASMGLREYIAHLTNLNMITPPSLSTDFLTIYEQARFSGEELNELEFRGLMSVFAEILRNMTPLDQAIIDELHAEAEELELSSSSESIIAAGDAADDMSLRTNETVSHTPQPDIYPSNSTSDSASTTSSTPSNHGTIHTVPSRPSATRNDSNISRTTRTSQRRGLRTPSIPSLRPVRSFASGSARLSVRSVSSGGSVIRLKEARTRLDLPFKFVTGDEGGE